MSSLPPIPAHILDRLPRQAGEHTLELTRGEFLAVHDGAEGAIGGASVVVIGGREHHAPRRTHYEKTFAVYFPA